MELARLVQAFAHAIVRVDGQCVPFVSRTGRIYQEGIGPYGENQAMALVLQDVAAAEATVCGQFIPYPMAPRQKCDAWIGDPLEWVIEIKMGRFRGDNGKPDDTGIKDLISPFRQDRSALVDATKLAEGGFDTRKAILIYGFDDVERPLTDALDALDLLLRDRVSVLGREEAAFDGLRHPVFQAGRVVAWEIGRANGDPGQTQVLNAAEQISAALKGPTASIKQAMATAGLPSADGFYAWWAPTELLKNVPAHPHPVEAVRLLYIGIAPGRNPAKLKAGSKPSTVRSRVCDQHLAGNTGSSTLKLVLAALLLKERGYRPVRRARKTLLQPEDRRDLRRWQEAQLRLTWVEWPRRGRGAWKRL